LTIKEKTKNSIVTVLLVALFPAALLAFPLLYALEWLLKKR
jgi:hypothetical protein